MSLTHPDLDWSVAPPPVKRKESKKEDQPEEPPKFITGVEGDQTNEEPPEPEVRLLSAEWIPGPNGFCHNDQCFLKVNAEFLKETIRVKLRGKLFCTFDGEEEDLCQEVTGELDSDGTALINIEHLWFVGNRHYNAWRKDPMTPCSYSIKNISHTRGENTINSPVLEMPAEGDIRGGVLVTVIDNCNRSVQGVKAILKTGTEELFNDTLSDGALEVSGIT
ncbi:hypothetical protein QA601_08955 [Chitinispirillales bacterium ANBcel5]|uniref:hypothetical protein n=1 Tax=Cellulosispirillum alkaliphilum TaxID=3039283 RepID=UPI002A5867B3|nr:hypothetical protein [Chitinispirillales bacterium ANBcel5]